MSEPNLLAPEQLRLIADTAPALVAYIDAEQRYRYVNRQHEVTFGWHRGDVLGRTMTDVLGTDAMERVRNHVEQALRGEHVHVQIESPFGERKPGWFEASYTPDRNAKGEIIGFASFMIDITAQKRAEEGVRAGEADRSRDEFLATLAHELRNPLAPICNAVEILNRAAPRDPALRTARDMIDRQVQHMVRLVDDLLDVSRLTRGKLQLRKERVALDAVLSTALEAARPHIERARHRLIVSLPSEPLHLHADPVRLAQVFSNLLHNASKYTEPSGEIALTAERQGSDVVVKVRDTGIGIAAEQLPHVFDMFAQVSPAQTPAHGGLGIGLSLARGLVQRHDGYIEAVSEGVGRGSEFIVRLPLHVGGSSATTDHPAEHGVTGMNMARHILVVDDNRDSAESLAMLLRMSGHQVETAYDGAEGFAAAKRSQPEVVLLDIGMPKLDGYEVCRRIRDEAWGQRMVLIAQTGWGTDGDRQRTEAAGFDAHLVKPLDVSALMGLLAELQPTRTMEPR